MDDDIEPEISRYVVNELDFPNCSLPLTSQFFGNVTLSVLFRADVKAGYFNRYRLACSADNVFDCSCELLFGVMALFGRRQESIDQCFNSFEPTSIAKPYRIGILLMIVTLASFGYSITQRRVRVNLGVEGQMSPGKINQSVQYPTLHWFFQLFEGINFIMVISSNGAEIMVGRSGDLRQKNYACWKLQFVEYIEFQKKSRTNIYLLNPELIN